MSLSHRIPHNHGRQGGGQLAGARAHVNFASRIGKNAPSSSEWRRMVIFQDPTGAVCQAVIALYRQAWRAAGAPTDAALYLREVGGLRLLYFSPAATLFSDKLFEVFPADRTRNAPELEKCSIVPLPGAPY